MPKRKKRGVQKKKKDDSPGDLSECESLDRLPSAKKVAAASSTSQLEDEVDQISSFTSISLLNSSKSESGEIAALSSSHFFCNYCEFSAESKSLLLPHMRQHMIKCPHCSFSSLSRIEVSRHCKHEHEEDPEGVSQEVDSSSADCEMDKDPCTSCVFCSFMTYSTEHLEKHTLHKHPGMLARSVARMITKQNSTDIRRDDALFYLSVSNEGLAKSSGYNLIASEKSSSPIVIDPIVNKAEDVKPEIKYASYTKSSLYSSQQTGQLMEQTHNDNHTDTTAGEKMTSRSAPAKGEASSGMSMLVKVETLYCLTCPYSSVYIEKLKCHTVVQHPVGAAVASYNSTGVGAEDITFFCVREDCSQSSSDCASYQKHLMYCCACQKTLKVLEKERLKSTITYILEHQRKYRLPAVDGFFDFASPFLDVCLPPTLTGISSASVEDQPFHQRRNERSHNIPQNSVMNTEKICVESSPLSTDLYKTPGHLSSTAVSSSGSSSTESHSSNSSRSFFPQQLQGITQNIYSANNSTGEYQNQMLHNPVILPVQTDNFSRNIPADGRLLQSVQNHSAAFYPQSQGNYSQPSTASSLVTSYPDTPQATVSWQTGQAQPTGLASIPVQSEQNYSNAFPTQNLEVNTGLRAQNSATFNSLNQSRSDSFSLGQNSEMNQNFMPATSHSYAPSPGHVSQTPGNGSDLHINVNPSFPGQPTETSANNVSNVIIASDAMTISNPMPASVFYGQHNPVSSALNTTNIDQSCVDTQPLPKMVDLLSDSYSILLSDEFGPDGQMQQVTDNNFIQTPQAPACPPQYHPEAASSTQSQAVVSQSPAVMPQGQPAPYQPMQNEGSRFRQLAVDSSQLPSCGNQFSFPVPNQNNQVTSTATSLVPNSGFQTAQGSNNCGALQRTLSSEESSCVQPARFQSSEVPNFLVSPGTPSSEMGRMQPHSASSFNNRHPSIGQPGVGRPGTFTPPKNSNASNKFAGASPLSPSIYLSGQVPRHRRSNWTDADMSPRGMMLSGVPPRHIHPPVPAPGAHSYMNQRPSVPGRRGFSRGPRMSSGRGRMPTPRMPNNQVGGGGDDDDDVILTAVIRGTPPKNQQLHQQPGGRGTYRGVSNPPPRGRSQVLPVQNRHRSQNPAPRVPYPVAPLPPQTHKQFDISKHFEDLACVVNASADEGEGGGDDIQIVAVTPGKDKEKANQPKAVDASKFSFCCVHCGKDQGSKTVMKQHMKARHNDSLLGAFTNTETGQLLFFCPQLTCEFMTYDEKRLSEHLSKCYDMDRSKPFDFGTAIKNLKSLKIRQLDVRTMGRSQDYPIDLDGQGMKDNFSSSLNDAFGDIVVNASGRHMLRNATPPHQTRPSQSQFQSLPTQSGAIQNKAPVRMPPSSNIATRLGHPRFPQQANMGSRMNRPMAPFQYTKQQNYDISPNPRQIGPANMPMDPRNIRDVRPRAPSSVAHHQSMPLRAAPPSNVMTPRMPSRGQQDPVVIVIDVDSPERPEEGQQNEPMVTESPEITNQMSLVSSGQTYGSETLSQHGIGCSETMNTNSLQEQRSLSDNPDLISGDPMSASPDLNLGSRLSHDDSGLNNTIHASQLPSVINQAVSYSCDRIHTAEEAPGSDEEYLQQNSVTLSAAVSTDSYSAALGSGQEDEPSSAYSPETSTIDSNASVSDRIMGNSTSYSTEYAPTSLYAPIESCDESQVTEHVTNSSDDVPTGDTPSVTPIPPASSHLSMELAGEYFDEEEKVNALVLEKVFAKVPNMPKNLSRRLVAKFKEYAKHRGVKITTDSKVIDEFVSKIYYKGSGGDKAASRPQPVPDASQFQPGGLSHVATVAHLAPATPNSSMPSSENIEPTEGGGNYESSQEYPDDHNTDSVQKDLQVKERDSVQKDPQVKERDQEELPAVADLQVKERAQEKLSAVADLQVKERAQEELPTVADLQVKERAQEELPAVADLQVKERAQEELPAVSDPSFSEQTSANEVVTTHVILAERTLHFSPTFASIAMKSSAVATQMFENIHGFDVGQKNMETNQLAPAKFIGSVLKSDMNNESTTVSNRRNSIGESLLPRPVTTLRRSGSLSQLVSSVPGSSEIATFSEQHIHEDLEIEPPSNPVVTADVTGSPGDTPTPVSPEDCEADASEPASEVVEDNLPVICKDQLKEEVEISFPPAPESETMPILISSSVADIVSGHPGLEVDIAGIPLKQELLDEDNRYDDNVDEHGDNDISKHHSDQEVSHKEDMFEKVTPTSSNIINKTTGKLLLKKTKRGRPRKLFTEKEEKQPEESKNLEAEEEHIVRRSSRSRKPVNKDYRSDANEIDELMSDDDDEYLIDEDDYDTDTDGDWRGGDPEQPPKKRIKKVVPPPDPTAFDISTKGKFKCWLCKKMFSRCSFAKSHIIQKHKEGLCAVYMDKSEDSKTLCLLVFCPRKCRYVTLSLEGLMNHAESCAETQLEADGKPYLEINKGFLDNKYKELQGMTLEAVLNIPKTRKPKDPTKSIKVKKSVNMNKSAAATPVVIHHSEASVIIKADGPIASPVVTSTVSSSVPVATSPAPFQTAHFQTATSHRLNIVAHGPVHLQPAVKSPTATDLNMSITSNKNFFFPPKPTQHSSPQLSSQHPLSVAIDVTNPHYHHAVSSPVSSSRPVAYNKHPPAQQMFSTSDHIKAGGSFPQPALPRMSSCSLTTDQEDDIVYMIEDNGTICLK